MPANVGQDTGAIESNKSVKGRDTVQGAIVQDPQIDKRIDKREKTQKRTKSPSAPIGFLDRKNRLHQKIHEENARWSGGDEMEEPSAQDRKDFIALLEKTSVGKSLRGEVVKGLISAITDSHVVIDIGLKTEGRVPIKEFETDDKKPEVGEYVEVFLESVENALGDAVLSREKVRYGKAWRTIENAFANKEVIEGMIVEHVRGGFIVELDQVRGFLPGSQADLRPVRVPQTLVGTKQKFHILKIDKNRESIIVSRRALLEQGRKEHIEESLKKIKEGEIVDGIVKNLTNYGAFVDLNGFDGLLHVADMSWRRIAHPSELFSPGDKVRVKIVRISPDFRRVSLGIKQLEEDPWKDIEGKYQEGTRLKGTVVNIEDYGAFVEVAPGIEGLVHVSEMSWGRKSITPSQFLSTGQEVEVKVLKVNQERRRISLGIKQCNANPWEAFEKKNPIDSIVEGTIHNTTDFGIFVTIDDNIDGLIHVSDVSWDTSHSKVLEQYKEGEAIKVQILSIDVERGRVSLGIKQMSDNPYGPFLLKHKKGDVVTCVVKMITEAGIDVSVDGFDDLSFFIKRQALSSERSEQDTKRFRVGEKMDAMISEVKKDVGKVVLSIRDFEEVSRKEVVKLYGSEHAGASLKDILIDHFDEKGNKKTKELAPKEPVSKELAPKELAPKEPAPKESAKKKTEKTSS